MSTPEGNIDSSAAGAAGATLPTPETDWLTSFHIDDPVDGLGAPLPLEPVADAAKSADAGPGQEPPEPAKEAAPEKKPDATVEAAKEPPAEAKTEGDKPPDQAAADLELSTKDKEQIEKLPEAEQPEARNRAKRAYFMDHFLDPLKPKEEVRQHLKERSESQYAELETAIVKNYLAKPEEFAASTYQRDPETYGKLALAIYNGDPATFAKLLTGRDNLTPEQIKASLDFHDRYKDTVSADEVEPLSAADEAKIAEMEEYFPEEAARLRKTLEAQATLAEENRVLREKVKPEDAADPNKAAVERQAELAKEINEIWDEGRDAVGSYITSQAYDPAKGVGIHVTKEEREASPMVALLKDLKASVLFDGLMVDAKTVLPSFLQGFTEWGKDREEFKEKMLQMDRFTQARERRNVLEVADGVKPLANTYYQERLKNPVFKAIDDLIALATKHVATTPKMDAHVPGKLPSTAGGKNGAASTDDWLVQDAVARAG